MNCDNIFYTEEEIMKELGNIKIDYEQSLILLLNIIINQNKTIINEIREKGKSNE